jgi:uncharacterized protein (DUF2164 family)
MFHRTLENNQIRYYQDELKAQSKQTTKKLYDMSNNIHKLETQDKQE